MFVTFTLLTSVADVPARSALRASSSGDLVVPRTRRRIGDKTFSVAAPRARNTLPTQLKLLWSTTTFRRLLKIFLFQPAYEHRDADCCLLCDAPSVFRTGRNTNDSVTVTPPPPILWAARRHYVFDLYVRLCVCAYACAACPAFRRLQVHLSYLAHLCIVLHKRKTGDFCYTVYASAFKVEDRLL